MAPNLLATARLCIINALCRRPKSTISALILIILVYIIIGKLKKEQVEPAIDWDARFEEIRRNQLREHMSFYVDEKLLKPVPQDWTGQANCPACFGTDLCSAIEKQEIVVEIPEKETAVSKKGVYLGKWQDMPVAVKRLSNWHPKEFELFDKFVCRNVTGLDSCNVSDAIGRLVASEAVFRPDYLHQAWRISYPQTGAKALTYAMCVTDGIVTTFKKLFDPDQDGKLDANQKAMLFTSMVVQPESLMLKFLKDIQFQRISPRIYGACGRVVIVAHGGRLLYSYNNASFLDRAELALQLVNLVQILWHADRRWFAMYTDFQYENIAVSHDKEIYLLDYEELSIIQNADFDLEKDEDHHEVHKFGEDITCNEDCVTGLMTRLSDEKISASKREEACQSLHSVSGAYMYIMLCRNILSDLAEHRAIADQDGTPHRGLLHDAPTTNDEAKQIEKALKECVNETKPGGRIEAINSLSDVLSFFL